MKMVDQFNQFREVKKKAKENHKAKGPVDIKELRRTMNEANKENRKP